MEDGLEAAKKIGFPVMIKASEGGGGKGIRKSNGPEDFSNFFRQVTYYYNSSVDTWFLDEQNFASALKIFQISMVYL